MDKQERETGIAGEDGAAPSQDSDQDVLVAQSLALCLEVVREPTPNHVDQERLFAELDRFLATANRHQTESILRDPRFGAIRERLLLVRTGYEYARECVLARAIVKAKSEAPLKDFRSAKWYEEAHEFEIRALAPHAPRNLLIVGAGPFPTTAISFLRANPHATVTCIDNNIEACELGNAVARVCQCTDLEIRHADALDMTDFHTYDCVIVGTVVGILDADKRRIVEHYKRWVPPATLLVFRTATGPGRIIYPSIDPALLDDIEYTILEDPPQKTFTMILTNRRCRAA